MIDSNEYADSVDKQHEGLNNNDIDRLEFVNVDMKNSYYISSDSDAIPVKLQVQLEKSMLNEGNSVSLGPFTYFVGDTVNVNISLVQPELFESTLYQSNYYTAVKKVTPNSEFPIYVSSPVNEPSFVTAKNRDINYFYSNVLYSDKTLCSNTELEHSIIGCMRPYFEFKTSNDEIVPIIFSCSVEDTSSYKKDVCDSLVKFFNVTLE